MILDLTKNELHRIILIKSLKYDKSASKPGDTEQVEPNVLKRHRETN